MKPMFKASARGFTLMETIIVIGILGLMLTAIVSMIFAYMRSFDTQQASVEVGYTAAALVNAVEESVLQANSVLVSQTISGTLYTTSSTTLVLRLPSIDGSGGVISGSYDYVAFYASGTDAYRIVSAAGGSVRTAGTKRLTTKLQMLGFTYDTGNISDASAVTVNVRTQAVTRARTVQYQLIQQVYLRNK